jgi:hypothetical protein
MVVGKVVVDVDYNFELIPAYVVTNTGENTRVHHETHVMGGKGVGRVVGGSEGQVGKAGREGVMVDHQDFFAQILEGHIEGRLGAQPVSVRIDMGCKQENPVFLNQIQHSSPGAF